MKQTAKVLIFAPREETPDQLKKLETAGCRLVIGEKRWQLPGGKYEDDLIEATRDADALMGTSIRETPITARVMQASNRLRVISKYTVGIDDIDIEAATALGILVCNAPTEANCFGVAESTVAMMLTMLKKIRERDADIRAGRWRERNIVATYVGSRASDDYPGITLGLIGLGRIASRVADLLAPWKIRIIGYDPYVDIAKFLRHGVERVDYVTALREADVLSFHVTLTKETHHMLRDEQLALVKPSAIVINTSRGKVIHEAALANAISNGKLAGAAIDVFEHEPLASHSPLRELGYRVLMTPHSAAATDGDELRAGVEMSFKTVLTALDGKLPDNICNPTAVPLWKERFGNASLIPN
jgi:D-3-phosphoglycerate dehydrogenase / 2-oxoglutarate reductase